MVLNQTMQTVLAVGVTLASIPVVQAFITDANLTGGLALIAGLVPLIMIFGVTRIAAGTVGKK